MSDPQVAIQELTDAGYSEARIAQELRNSEGLNVVQSTIHRIKNGQQSARFDVGQGLIRLRERLLPKAIIPVSGASHGKRADCA